MSTDSDREAFRRRKRLSDYMFNHCTHSTGDSVPSWLSCRECTLAFADVEAAAGAASQGAATETALTMGAQYASERDEARREVERLTGALAELEREQVAHIEVIHAQAEKRVAEARAAGLRRAAEIARGDQVDWQRNCDDETKRVQRDPHVVDRLQGQANAARVIAGQCEVEASTLVPGTESPEDRDERRG